MTFETKKIKFEYTLMQPALTRDDDMFGHYTHNLDHLVVDEGIKFEHTLKHEGLAQFSISIHRTFFVVYG